MSERQFQAEPPLPSVARKQKVWVQNLTHLFGKMQEMLEEWGAGVKETSQQGAQPFPSLPLGGRHGGGREGLTAIGCSKPSTLPPTLKPSPPWLAALATR